MLALSRLRHPRYERLGYCETPSTCESYEEEQKAPEGAYRHKGWTGYWADTSIPAYKATEDKHCIFARTQAVTDRLKRYDYFAAIEKKPNVLRRSEVMLRRTAKNNGSY